MKTVQPLLNFSPSFLSRRKKRKGEGEGEGEKKRKEKKRPICILPTIPAHQIASSRAKPNQPTNQPAQPRQPLVYITPPVGKLCSNDTCTVYSNTLLYPTATNSENYHQPIRHRNPPPPFLSLCLFTEQLS